MPPTLEKPTSPVLPTFSPESWLLPPLQPLKVLPPNYRTGKPPIPAKPARTTAAKLRQNLNKHGGREIRARAPETKGRTKLTTIRLYGVLGKKYGRVYRLDVKNVGEAISAIDALRPGFRKALIDLDQGFDFVVRVGKRHIREQELPMYTLGKTICITPVAHGAGGAGLWETIGGVVLAIVGVLLIETGFGAALIVAGIGLVIGGIAALIAGTPNTQADAKHQTSYQFSTAQNIAVQGAPCALIYGYPWCGSVVESSSIVNQDYRTGTVKNHNQTINSNTIGGLFSEELGDGTMINADGPGAGVGGSELNDGTISGTTGGGGGGGGGGIGGGPVLAEYQQQRTEGERREAMGAGGGSSSGSGAKEDPDTLSSRQYAALKDIIGEGPVQGLGAAQQSITFDRTPVQNPDHTFNFEDYEIHFVSGRQDQGIIPGFDSEEATEGEGFQLRRDFPFVRTLENPNLDAIRISVRVPKLEKQSSKNGDISGASVQLTIELNINGQGWVQKINDNIQGKASSPYTRDYRIDIPADKRPGTYQVRVTRITEDSTSQLLANDTYVDSITQIVYTKLRHPNTVKCGIKINAQQFSNIPTRAYRIYGLLMNVPSNYDPVAHTYNGDWDGTFKTAWTCNPAWILFDLILNNRYGLGNYINFGNTDKWAFYRAGVYCDEIVPNGTGGTERRYECHAYIAGRQDAMQVVSDICGIFRAAAAYIGGQIIPVLDKYVDPSEYAGQFSPDNVVNGDFAFANSSRKARHTVALVTWNDPDQNGDAQVEYVENSSQVHRYGVRELNVTAMGCYSRGQAHRTGLWLLKTEELRTEICTFKTFLEGATLRPGDVIQITAPFRAGKTMAGRMADGCTPNTLVLDHPVTIEAGSTYQISIADTTGKLVEAAVANPPGTYSTLNLTHNLAALPSQESTWILIASTLVPELFRVQTVNMIDTATVEITAISYNPSLYDTVDKGTPLDTYPTTNLPSAVLCLPPANLALDERAVVEGTGVYRVLEATWTASTDDFLRDYGIRYRINKGNWLVLPNSVTTTADIPIQVTGTYEFSVQAFNALGAASTSISDTYTVNDANPLPLFIVSGLQLYGNANGTQFGGRDIQLEWLVNSPTNSGDEFGSERYGSGTGGLDPSFQDFQVDFYRPSDGALVYSTRTLETQFTLAYDQNCQMKAPGEATPQGPYRSLVVNVTGHDKYGQSTIPATLTVANSIPAQIAANTVVVVYQFSNISFRIPGLNDIDLSGVKIWGSATRSDIYNDANPQAIPAGQFLVYDGASTTCNVVQPPGSTFYYRFAAYDAFNSSEFNISDVLTVTNNFLSEDDFTTDLRNLLGIIEPTAAGLYQETQNRVTADSALQTTLNIVYALAGSNSAAITTLASTFASYQTAEADLTTTLQVQVDANKSEIENESIVRANADSATAQQISTLGVQVGNVQSSVQQEATARANADGGLAQTISTVSTSVGNLSSTVSTQATALVGINGRLSAAWGLTLNANGYISGMKFLNDGTFASVVFQTDSFKIVSASDPTNPIVPFDVEDGSIIIGVPMRSYNYSPGVAGWLLSPDGYSEFNNIRSTTTTQNITLQAPTGLYNVSNLSTNVGYHPKLNCPSAANSGAYNVHIQYTEDGSSPFDGGTVVPKGTYIGPFYPQRVGDSIIIRAIAVFADNGGNVNAALGTSPEATGECSWNPSEPLP